MAELRTNSIIDKFLTQTPRTECWSDHDAPRQNQYIYQMPVCEKGIVYVCICSVILCFVSTTAKQIPPQTKRAHPPHIHIYLHTLLMHHKNLIKIKKWWSAFSFTVVTASSRTERISRVFIYMPPSARWVVFAEKICGAPLASWELAVVVLGSNECVCCVAICLSRPRWVHLGFRLRCGEFVCECVLCRVVAGLMLV